MDLYYVYLIETVQGRFYCGITKDYLQRFQEHLNDKTKGAKFFRMDQPKAIVFLEECASRSEALKLEAKLKKISRKKKELIASPA